MHGHRPYGKDVRVLDSPVSCDAGQKVQLKITATDTITVPKIATVDGAQPTGAPADLHFAQGTLAAQER